MSESLFSHASGVVVTRGRVQLPRLVFNGRLVAEARTYSLANITSVSMQTIPPSTGCLSLAGFVFALAALGAIPNALMAEDVGQLPMFIGSGLFSAVIAWACFNSAKGRRPHYVVLFRTAGVEDRALATPDKDLAEGLIAAVNEAMDLRSA